MEWDPHGKFVWRADDKFAHPSSSIKCYDCVMRHRVPFTHKDGTVTDDGYMYSFCRAWPMESGGKPFAVLWEGADCEAYWPEDGNWIGDEPM